MAGTTAIWRGYFPARLLVGYCGNIPAVMISKIPRLLVGFWPRFLGAESLKTKQARIREERIARIWANVYFLEATQAWDKARRKDQLNGRVR